MTVNTVTVTTGAGNDRIDIRGGSNTTIRNILTINTGAGNDQVTLGSLVAGETVLNLLANANIITGDGNDTVSLLNMSNQATIDLDMGNGVDILNITQSTLDDLDVDMGFGADTVTLTNNPLIDDSTFSGGPGPAGPTPDPGDRFTNNGSTLRSQTIRNFELPSLAVNTSSGNRSGTVRLKSVPGNAIYPPVPTNVRVPTVPPTAPLRVRGNTVPPRPAR